MGCFFLLGKEYENILRIQLFKCLNINTLLITAAIRTTIEFRNFFTLCKKSFG